MGEIFKENKDSIARWVNIALIVLIYYFGRKMKYMKLKLERLYKKDENETGSNSPVKGGDIVSKRSVRSF